MTLEEAIKIVEKHQEWRMGADTEMEHPRTLSLALNTLILGIKKLQEKLSDRLPNGGMRVHGIKNSMQPTTENDKF